MNPTHTHIRQLLNRPESSWSAEERKAVQAHLLVCKDCSSGQAGLQAVDNYLRENLPARWPDPGFNPQILTQKRLQIEARIRRKNMIQNAQRSFNKTLSATGVVFAAIALVLVLVFAIQYLRPWSQGIMSQGAGSTSTPFSEERTVSSAPLTSLAPELNDRSQFFTITAQDEITRTLKPQVTETYTEPLVPGSIEEAQALVGFPILLPSYLPDGYQLNQINYYPESPSIGILYSLPDDTGSGFYLIQQQQAFSDTQVEVGPSVVIQPVVINGLPGEFVSGQWEDNGSSDSVGRWRWNSSGSFGRLRWDQDGIHYQISVGNNDDMELAVKLAESLGQFNSMPHETVEASVTAAPSTISPTTPITTTNPVLKTTMDDFLITSARFVDEVNGTTAGSGERILLIALTLPGLERLDPVSFSLEAFAEELHRFSNGEIYVQGDDGSYSICTMSGWVDDEFVIGFRLPDKAQTYSLFWPGNEPIYILPVP